MISQLTEIQDIRPGDQRILQLINSNRESRHLTKRANENSRIAQILKNLKEPDNIPSFSFKIKGDILSSFNETGELFVFHENTFYTIGNLNRSNEKNPHSGKISYKGIEFNLDESENIKSIERLLLENNLRGIKNSYGKALALAKKSFPILEESSYNIQPEVSSRLERYIISDVLHVNQHGLEESRKNLKAIEKEINKIESEAPQIKDSIFSRLPVLPGLIKKKSDESRTGFNSIVGIFGYVYGIKSDKNPYISLEDVASFGECIGSITKLSKEYTKEIEITIGKSLAPDFNRVLRAVKRGREISGNIRDLKRREGVRFAKSGNAYTIYKDIPDFIIKKNGNYYHFPSATAGVTVLEGGNSAKIELPAFIKEKEYKHPFSTSYAGGNKTSICHGSLSWDTFGTIQAKGNWQPLNELRKRKFGEQIFSALDGIERILTTGLSASGANPYRILNRSSFSEYLVDSSEIQSLRSRGVRVYDNDFSTSGRCN